MEIRENRLIEEAFRRFAVKAESYQLIRRNENITCQVTDRKTAYCLRIRCPAEGFDTSLLLGQHDSAAYMQGEVDLLLHLHKQGFKGLQKPLAGPDGQYVYKLSDGSPAMLLSWVEGHTLLEEEKEKCAFALGLMAANLHRASKGFQGTRPAYDEGLANRMAAEIQQAAQEGHLTEAAAHACVEELQAVKKAMNRLCQEPGQWGIIHSDLNFGNVLLTKDGLVPIDFSLSGFGCYAQEAGMLQSNFQKDACCREVLRGFAQGGGSVEEADVEIFLAFSVLLFISAQHGKFYTESWFQEAVERWCGSLFVHW